MNEIILRHTKFAVLKKGGGSNPKTADFVNSYDNGIKLTKKFSQLSKTKGGRESKVFEQCYCRIGKVEHPL